MKKRDLAKILLKFLRRENFKGKILTQKKKKKLSYNYFIECCCQKGPSEESLGESFYWFFFKFSWFQES